MAQGQPPRQQTPEELAASARQQQEYQEQIKEQEKAKQKAKRAATKLFVGVVGRKAYGLFKKRGYHEVIGHSGKRYRLRLGVRIEEMAGNFGDSVSARLCIHTDAGIPEMDTLVIQMLLVMSGEDGEKVLHKTANRTAEAA